MPRVKISEFKAKSIVFPFLKEKHQGLSLTKANFKEKIKTLSQTQRFVLKVDEGIKKRGLQNLIFTNLKKSDVPTKIAGLVKKGFTNFLIENYYPHEKHEEKFLALTQVREGLLCQYATFGGVDIEKKTEDIRSLILTKETIAKISADLGVNNKIIENLVQAFDKLYLTFLEINPFIVKSGKFIPLDMAVEVDSAGEFFVGGSWGREDIIENERGMVLEEIEVKKLAATSSASFKLVVLNPKGSIFTIFSGGGASIVLADEVGNIGKGSELANYAEYSGGPTEEETYIFTKNILSLALKSPAKNKKIFIAGGVANFTDIRATFKGVIKALDEKKSELKKQGLSIFVRRGGPYQKEGLVMMSEFLNNAGLINEVMGPDRVLTEVITKT